MSSSSIEQHLYELVQIWMIDAMQMVEMKSMNAGNKL